jgi:aldose 1-epimerase
VEPFGGVQARVGVTARKQWELNDSLPSGKKSAFGSAKEEPFAALHLDHLLTDVPLIDHERRECGALETADGGRCLVVTASRDYRELVVFTPPHREAICFEPYTCATDAVNLQQQGIDAGLQILPPGALWHGWVEVQWLEGDEPGTAA